MFYPCGMFIKNVDLFILMKKSTLTNSNIMNIFHSISMKNEKMESIEILILKRQFQLCM